MTPSDGPTLIGIKHPGAPEGDYWNGMIDEIIIFNRGLTGDEIKTVMKGFASMFPPTTAVFSEQALTTTWGSIKER